MDSSTKKISDAFPAAKGAFAFHGEFERAEYFTLRERAYQLEDKIRFGLLTLNAGSILAIIAAASKDGLAGGLHLAPGELVVPLIVLIGGGGDSGRVAMAAAIKGATARCRCLREGHGGSVRAIID